VSLSLVSKIPGARMRVRPVNMEFLYGASFLSQSPEAYERLILDAMRGDATLFARGDEVEAAWAVCEPVLERFAADPAPLPRYPAGSPGPGEADAVLEPGTLWRAL
jgi:glucose-6-phosphate 1-dehydrogenase